MSRNEHMQLIANSVSTDHAFVRPQAGQERNQDLALTVSQKIGTKLCL